MVQLARPGMLSNILGGAQNISKPPFSPVHMFHMPPIGEWPARKKKVHVNTETDRPLRRLTAPSLKLENDFPLIENAAMRRARLYIMHLAKASNGYEIGNLHLKKY
jgi:hypothetical protein